MQLLEEQMEKCRFPGCDRVGQLEKILWPATKPLEVGKASPLAKGADIVLCDLHLPIVRADPDKYFEPDESFVPLF
jgi:hypothetical protein